MGQENVYISCNYSCTICFYGKMLLVKVPLYSICLNLNHKNQNSNQNGKVEKMAALVKTWPLQPQVSTFSTVL